MRKLWKSLTHPSTTLLGFSHLLFVDYLACSLLTATGQDSLDLLAQRLTVAQDLDSISPLNTAPVNTVEQNRSLAANSVIAQNNNIVTVDIWEQNEKTVNRIFLHRTFSGSPNSCGNYRWLMI